MGEVLGDFGYPMVIPGPYTCLEGADTLDRFVVAGEPVHSSESGGEGQPSEQVALYVWRVAMVRGGPRWTTVAADVAAWTEHRIREAKNALPLHIRRGTSATHTRFLCDAALLLLAVRSPLAGRALDAVESLGVAYGGGRWVVHDSRELEAGRNDLVLNTHLHAMLTLYAAGRDIQPYQVALDHSLTQGLLVADSGYVRRSGRSPDHPFYFAVNVADLAAVELNCPTEHSTATLHRALRYGRRSRFFRKQVAAQNSAAVWVPAALSGAGLTRAASRWASRLVQAGYAPVFGWPGHSDRPWPRLAEGTP